MTTKGWMCQSWNAGQAGREETVAPRMGLEDGSRVSRLDEVASQKGWDAESNVA